MNKISFNPKRDLPYLAALAQVVQFVHAGYILFEWAGAVSGLFLGALVSMSVAYATSQYTDTAKDRKSPALFFMVPLLAFSPVIVGTAAYLKLPAGLPWWWAIIVAAAWGILPDFSVALDGFIAGKGMVKRDEAAPSEVKPAKSKPEPLPEIEKPAFVCSCGYVAKSQAALSGHQLAHKPKKADVVGYVASFEPVTSDKKQK